MSEFIDLNDAGFDSSSSAIFNGGKGGKVNDASMRVEKKTTDDRSPDWKIFFVDAAGGEVNEGYYYVDETHENFKKRLKYQGSALRHMLHAAFGPETAIPKFASVKEMLDKCMLKLQSISPDVKFRVGVSYGTEVRPDAYLRVRNYPPFMEPMTVPENESVIIMDGRYLLERPVPTETSEDEGDFDIPSTPVTTEDAPDTKGFDAPHAPESSDAVKAAEGEVDDETSDLPF